MKTLAINTIMKKLYDIPKRALQDQIQRENLLSIPINLIVIWNAVYLSKSVETLKSKYEFNEELLKHISSLGWEHINFLSEYRFNIKDYILSSFQTDVYS